MRSELSSQLSQLSPPILRALQAQLEASIHREETRTRLWTYYPDRGPLRRDLYGKHMEFYEAGLFHQERAFVASNRSGKTHCVAYETTLHMLGQYPEWWRGRRYQRPIVAWLAGEDAKSVRESLQFKLLGAWGEHGTGLVLGNRLLDVRSRSGIPETVDTFAVKHKSGRLSRGVFKAYEQGRESFQAASVDVMCFDEEPPLSIYSEGLTRTMSTVPGEPNGLVMCSFTPLKGLSDTVLQFLPGGRIPETIEARREAWKW